MSKYRALIIDDEPLARLGLKRLLTKINPKDMEVIGEASNGLEALDLIETRRPNLLFLDIQMPGFNGFEMLQQLSQVPLVIFTTAYDQFALKAFETQALDYLLKPIKPDHLQRALNKLESLQNIVTGLQSVCYPNFAPEGASKPYLRNFAIKCGTKWEIIPEEEVLLFFSKEKFCYLKSKGMERIINQSLQDLEKKLDPEKFIRVHRSVILSLKQVRHYKSLGSARLEITLNDGTKVKSSRSFSGKFKKISTLNKEEPK